MNTLAYLWTNQFPAQRILFFTYRFNFEWFHNEVLVHLREAWATDGLRIDVLATRFDDDAPSVGSGSVSRSLYDLDEWARLRGRLRIRYLPCDRHLFHNKFILVDHGGRGGVSSGFGSANLTFGGWLHNLETWHWGTAQDGAAALDLFNRIPASHVSGDFLDHWRKRLRGLRSPLKWLAGADKAFVRKPAFRRLATSIRGAPRALRVVSPYFDKSSQSLLDELLATIRDQFDHVPPVEIWIDASGKLARKTDIATVMDIRKAMPDVTVKAVRRESESATGFERLHAKLIELEGNDGRCARIFGSANFTGAAWIEPRNTETISLEHEVKPLAAVLGNRVVRLQHRDLVQLASRVQEDEVSSEMGGRRCIYWAALDESCERSRLVVSYESPDKPRRFSFRGGFDPRRGNVHRAEEITQGYEDPRSWRLLSESRPGLVVLELTSARAIFPEHLWVQLHFLDGLSVESPVEPTDPNFDLRDERSGIPLEPGIDSLLVGARPIVDSIPKRIPIADEDAEHDEEEMEQPTAHDESLAGDPDYNRSPWGVRLAHAIKEALPSQLPALRARAKSFRSMPLDPKQQMLVEAAERALDEVGKP